MRAWGQLVALSVAIVAAAVVLNAQQKKPGPLLQSPPTSARSAARSIPSTKQIEQPGVLNRDTTFSLIMEAYDSSRDLPSEQRIPLLSEICDISASINFGRSHLALVHDARVRLKNAATRPLAELTTKQGDKLRDWAEELFQLGDEFPEGSQLRSEAEIAAARSMVSIDPKRAMELLDSVEIQPTAKVRDSRWSVVSALFNRLYDTDGASAFPDIRREALSLGDRGAYPYMAVLNLMNHVYNHPDVTRQFFADAVDYFRRSGNSRAQVYGVMSLLASDEIRKQLRPWQVQDAAAQVVASVKDYVQSQSEDRLNGESAQPNISAILWFVELTMKRFAPEMAAELPDPATVPEPNGYLLSVNADAHRTSPVAPIADDSTESLKRAFEESRTAMMKMGENEIHEGPEMQETIDRTVALGAEWVERTVQGYAPEDHAYAMVVSTTELAGVARLGAHINPAATLAAIRKIQDDELKSKLLLSVARTIEYLR